MVVINKVDRDSSRVEDVETEVFDLMCNLGATDEQLSYATVYASGRDGWATTSWPDGKRENMQDLLDTIVKSVPAPKVAAPPPHHPNTPPPRRRARRRRRPDAHGTGRLWTARSSRWS